MSTWSVVTGHNHVGTLAVMLQAPAMPGGIQYPEQRWSANMTLANHGVAYCDLVWNVIKRLPVGAANSIREQVLAQFGLSDSVPSAEVTVTLRDNNGDWTNYNATANLVSLGQRGQGWIEELTVRLTSLEVIAP